MKCDNQLGAIGVIEQGLSVPHLKNMYQGHNCFFKTSGLREAITLQIGRSHGLNKQKRGVVLYSACRETVFPKFYCNRFAKPCCSADM